MKKIIALLFLTALTACSSTQDLYKIIPSFWDDNQSHSIVTAYQQAVNIDCTQPQAAQAQKIVQELQWFQLYSESKGFLQHDVLELIAPMQTTATEWATRAKDKDPSAAYCKIKRDILVTQAKKASSAVLGRF